MMQFKMAMVLFFFYIGCVSTAAASGAIPVYVSIVPQKYFVEKIGGKLVDVSVMVEPGASPASYEPRPRQMVGLSKARIYYAVGAPFEKTWLKKIASVNPEMLIAHTEEGIKKIPMKSHHHEEDVHLRKKGRGFSSWSFILRMDISHRLTDLRRFRLKSKGKAPSLRSLDV